MPDYSSQRFRFHVLAVPHSATHPDYVACAYQMKVLKFCGMMTQRGHVVYHYGHERSEVECTEHITVTDDSVLREAYGDHDWRRHQFRHNVGDSAYQHFNRAVVQPLRDRIQPLDFLICPFGIGHQAAAQAVTDTGVIICEPGIGYTSGHFARWRAYESHAVRTAVEGARSPQDWYSRVIPNYFDPRDFDYSRTKQDYCLFLGRVSELKGISTCIRATEAAGVPLIIAGQGRIADVGWHTTPAHVTELGYADREQRRQLMRDASALIIATTYLEPFGGVVVEALLSGTPIITPFFGAFAEINRQDETGFLCATLADYVNALKNRHRIRPEACRARGFQYTLSAVAPQFERWFQDILAVYQGQGWNQL